MVCVARPLDGADVHIAQSSAVNEALVVGLGHEWTPVPNMPGTVHGSVELRSRTSGEKREEARSVIRSAIRKLLVQHEAAFDVIANVVLMIDGLGEAMIFDV